MTHVSFGRWAVRVASLEGVVGGLCDLPMKRQYSFEGVVGGLCDLPVGAAGVCQPLLPRIDLVGGAGGSVAARRGRAGLFALVACGLCARPLGGLHAV